MYEIHARRSRQSVTWKRNVEESYVDNTNKVRTTSSQQAIDQVLIIWNAIETVTKVADNSFCASISTIKALIPDCTITLAILGIQDYFVDRKKAKTASKDDTSKRRNQNVNERSNGNFNDLPKVSRRQLETCLNEVQITAKCNTRLVNNAQELALMICQYTKAIAEMPYKLKKNKSLENKFDWYVMGDNRNTVRVDKDGNGLRRLWQQQLCQFNLSSLEIAEAICSVYPSPANLIDAYTNCTDNEGMHLIKDIPVRRAAGPLTASRKIGLELSKKIYTMFTSEDGEVLLQ